MMKIFLLKASLTCSLFFLLSNTKAFAQSGPVVCKINYSYDGAGNRIKRAYVCAPTWTINDPVEWQNPEIFQTLYPNPTTGVFTGVFSEPVSSASFLISAMSGAVVQQYQMVQPASSITFDISAQVPGTYLLTVWALNKVETYTIIKMQ